MSVEIFRDIPLSLTREGLFRRMGYGGRKRPPAPEIMAQFDRALELLATGDFLYGRAALWIRELASITRKGITTICGAEIPGNRVFQLMPRATHVVLGLGTIGTDIENLSRDYIKKHDHLLGVMLDSMGSAAADCLAEEISGIVKKRAMTMGLMSSSPMSPGMPGLPLETQDIFFDLLPARELGMTITSKHLMVPFKSNSMLWGMGEKMPDWSGQQVCKACHLFSHCRYKTMKST